MSSAARHGAGGGRIRRAAQRYVQAKGGSRRAATAAASGRALTGRLGGFLVDVVNRGAMEAVQSLGVQVVGQSVEAVLATILNALAPPGTTDDDATARRAADETLKDLFERYGVIDGGLDHLNRMNADGVRDALQCSVCSYVYQRWLLDLSKKIEERAITADRAVRLERDVKVYVKDLIQLSLSGRDVLRMDWKDRECQRFIQEVYEQAYELLGK